MLAQLSAGRGSKGFAVASFATSELLYTRVVSFAQFS